MVGVAIDPFRCTAHFSIAVRQCVRFDQRLVQFLIVVVAARVIIIGFVVGGRAIVALICAGQFGWCGQIRWLIVRLRDCAAIALEVTR